MRTVLTAISTASLLATAAYADDVLWTSTQVGVLGPTVAEQVGTETLNLAGFAGGLPTALFGKQNAPSDFGLGLNAGPANEIGFIGFGEDITVTLPSDVTCPCNFQIQSLDVGESFQISTTGNILIAQGGADAATPGIALVTTNFLPPDRTFIVTAADASSSVLLHEVSATAAVPEPATLFLIGSGFAALGAAVRRRAK